MRKRTQTSLADGEFTRDWDDYDQCIIPGLPNSLFCESIWPKLFTGEIDKERRMQKMLQLREVNWFWHMVVDDCKDMFDFQLKVNQGQWLGIGKK